MLAISSNMGFGICETRLRMVKVKIHQSVIAATKAVARKHRRILRAWPDVGVVSWITVVGVLYYYTSNNHRNMYNYVHSEGILLVVAAISNEQASHLHRLDVDRESHAELCSRCLLALCVVRANLLHICVGHGVDEPRP